MLTRVWLIARREYVERILTRGFIITTILIPVLMGGFIFGSAFLGSKTTVDRHIAVVSADTDLVFDLQSELERMQRQKDNPADGASAHSATPSAPIRSSRILADAMYPGPEVRSELNEEVESGDLDGYLWITPASSAGARPQFFFAAKSGSSSAIRNTLAIALEQVLLREQLAHRGVIASEMDALLQPVTIAAVQNAHHNDRESAQLSVSILFFIMYLVIMLYGMNVARSVIDEKTSRIFEVLLATVRPEAMMAGKIIGVGSVGLTQVGIWLGAGLLFALSSTSIHLGSETLHFSLTTPQVVYFLVFLVLGYLFYSAIAAALGAMTNSEQELQQLNVFLMLPLLVCFAMLGHLLSSPDSTLSRVLALIPPFTPLLMYMRISLGHPAAWEIVLSLLLLMASIYGLIWITSRIYRVGVLMYGKRPSIAEILRWLRYS